MLAAVAFVVDCLLLPQCSLQHSAGKPTCLALDALLEFRVEAEMEDKVEALKRENERLKAQVKALTRSTKAKEEAKDQEIDAETLSVRFWLLLHISNFCTFQKTCFYRLVSCARSSIVTTA